MRIILMRHGEAEMSSRGGDFARRLTTKGEVEAKFISQKIAQAVGTSTVAIISSDSERTAMTTGILKSELGASATVNMLRDFYDGNFSDMQSAILEDGRTIDVWILVGHNPGWSAAVHFFSGQNLSMQPADAVILDHSVYHGVNEQERIHALNDAGGWRISNHFTAMPTSRTNF
jgi:phosphohistidine phosphatase SixA